jgi:hypothetical protein
MTSFDPADEELRRRYAGLSDGELEKIADDLPELTDAARQALTTELSARGLDSDRKRATESAPVDETSARALVTIRQFRDLPEALLAKGMLDSGGIESFLADDNMVRMDWFISNLIGGVKLQVAPQDVQEASELLDLPIPPEFDVEGIGEFSQPACPKCGSLDIAFETINKPVALTTAWLIAPIPIPRNSWKCSDCGVRWVEEPDDGAGGVAGEQAEEAD